ncbi:MAG TPA: hypothetical protein VHJ20_01970 [Polyangia bacterium]|nr:hypothetical protein [Polyangia bacterium]
MTSRSWTRGATLAAFALLASLVTLVDGCGRQLVGGVTRAPELALTSTASSPTPGQMFKLTATALAGSTVSLEALRWTSSDPSIVALDTSAGPTVMAHAVAAGHAVITAGAGATSGSLTITVLASVGNVEIDGPTSLDLGAAATYSATVTDGTGAAIAGASASWVANGSVQLSNPLQTLGATVKIRAVSLGAGAVTASAGGRVGQIAVRVSIGAGGALTVTPADGSAAPSMLAVGQMLDVQATFAGQNGIKAVGSTATWTATGGCTAVDQTGGRARVTGSTAGSCTVTASAMGVMGTATFTVVGITGVKIKGDASALQLGASTDLTAVALAGTTEVPTVPVTWSQDGPHVANVSVDGNVATATGVVVGTATLTASVGPLSASTPCVVVPGSLALTADAVRLLSGGSATVTVTPKGTGSVAGKFTSATGVSLAGAMGFTTVGPATLTSDGLVTFALTGATAGSPTVTATYGTLTSNALAFTLTTVGSVTVNGPNGPVRIGSPIDLTLDVRDAQGMPIAGGVGASWSDPTGVLTLPATTTGFSTTATVAKLGDAMLVATVRGVASAVYSIPGVPNELDITSFSPASVSVGGTATITVKILDTNGVAVPGVPATAVTAVADDPTKVSVSAAVAMGDGFQFTATGLAATSSTGALVTATWTGGTEVVMSAAVPLVVTP